MGRCGNCQEKKKRKYCVEGDTEWNEAPISYWSVTNHKYPYGLCKLYCLLIDSHVQLYNPYKIKLLSNACLDCHTSSLREAAVTGLKELQNMLPLDMTDILQLKVRLLGSRTESYSSLSLQPDCQLSRRCCQATQRACWKALFNLRKSSIGLLRKERRS